MKQKKLKIKESDKLRVFWGHDAEDKYNIDLVVSWPMMRMGSCDGSEYIDILQKTGPEEFEFFTQFHNGGTCLEEVLSEELSKVEKVAPIKAKIDEIETMIKQNADDFKNGIIDYVDLHNSQYI